MIFLFMARILSLRFSRLRFRTKQSSFQNLRAQSFLPSLHQGTVCFAKILADLIECQNKRKNHACENARDYYSSLANLLVGSIVFVWGIAR